jgi:hypothetical protein
MRGRPPRARGPGRRRQLPASGARERPADAATAWLAVAALLVVPSELAVTALIKAHGGWQVNGLRTALAGAGQLAGNARLAGQGLLELCGADVLTAPPGVGTALAVAHLAGAVLAAAGVLSAARGFFRRDELVEQVLLLGIAVDLAAYLSGVQAVNILSTREIVPVLPFAAVLAGRLLAPRLDLRLAPGRLLAPRLSPARPTPRAPCTSLSHRAPGAAVCALLAVYAAGLGYAAARPPAPSQDSALGGWLRAHQLTAGLSGYHQANIVTLATGGAVTLRPVIAGPGGKLTAYQWNASSAWFDPARATATFLVLDTPATPAAPATPGSSSAPGSSSTPGAPAPSRTPGLTVARATATFGPPARRYRYQQYTVLVWPAGTNLLRLLHHPAHESPPPSAR